jgi:hypothetical protein
VPTFETPFQRRAEQHSKDTSDAVQQPATKQAASVQQAAQSSAKPLPDKVAASKETTETAELELPRATQLPESATSIALEQVEAGHARRFIKVPKRWYAKKGAKVMDGVFVGDALGKGLQVSEWPHPPHPCHHQSASRIHQCFHGAFCSYTTCNW